MLFYSLRRLAYLVPTLLGITIVTFVIISLAPGSPADVLQMNSATARVSPEAYQAMLELYGLNEPIHVRYFVWLGRVLSLDFGRSFLDQRPVMEKIGERLPATLLLNGVSLLLVLIIAVPMGLYSALHQKSQFDRMGGVVLYLLYSLPEFWIALLLIVFFGVKLHVLPFIGMESLTAGTMGFYARLWDHILHLILPTVCLTYGSLAFLSRFVRGSTLEVIAQDYVRTARAKGLAPGRIVWRHVFRNTLIPVVTLLGLLLPTLFSGSVIIEYIFSWPGIGSLFFDAVRTRDYPTVMGLSVVTSVLVLLSTLAADLLYAWFDPRVSYE